MISVIVPVYNAEKYLPACIESIIKQDTGDWELILVEDGSADGSPELIDEYAAKDERIRALHPGHGGAAAARNRGVEASRGEYICFVDSDDTVEPDYLSYMYKGAQQYDADIVCCGHDEPEEGAGFARGGEDDGFGLCGLEDLLYQRGMMSVPWGYLYRRSLWDEVRFPEGTEAEDMGTIYRLFMAAERAVKGGRICYHYIQRSSSTIYSTSPSRMRACYKHSRRMLHEIRTERPKARLAAASRHFSCCAQSLSETPLDKKGRFTERLYKDMIKLSGPVMGDKDARLMNRAAALITKVSPALLHVMLRLYYRNKLRRINKT